MIFTGRLGPLHLLPSHKPVYARAPQRIEKAQKLPLRALRHYADRPVRLIPDISANGVPTCDIHRIESESNALHAALDHQSQPSRGFHV